MTSTRAVVMALLAAVPPVAMLDAQRTESGVRLDVASVRPTGRRDGPIVFLDPPDGFSAQNTTVRELIMMAYGADYQRPIEGAPKWTSEDRFDVIAKAAGPLPAAVPGSSAPRRELVRELLATRFGLLVHSATRELPIYALVLAHPGRVGPRLRAAASECRSNCVSTGFGFLKSPGITLETFAALMGGRLGRRVENRTDLTGQFVIDLEYAPLQQVPADGTEAPATDGRPSLFTAVQEQLGLKLDATRGSVEALIIDRIEYPGPN